MHCWGELQVKQPLLNKIANHQNKNGGRHKRPHLDELETSASNYNHIGRSHCVCVGGHSPDISVHIQRQTLRFKIIKDENIACIATIRP
jgi:hypothetical protein